ncbi:MAG: hypothetical protein LBI69_01000 [Puniceicoccales bacterium]|jgi:hypothetical protein|nr:hypothetical protein [Puniceicoccales bacterium]
MLRSKRMRCAAIILAGMPLQSRADIIMNANHQAGSALLSQMCIYGYAASAVEIVKLMNIKNVAPIFAAMVLSDGINNAIFILKVMGPEVTVNILQEILALKQHGAAVEIFVKMDSEMMRNMLLFIKKAQETQGNPAKILEIFNLLSQKNAINVFKIMLKFEGGGNQFTAEILATTMNQERAMEVLVALSIKSATKIIKFMHADESYKAWVLKIAPSLKQCDKGEKILNAAKIKV